MNGNKFKTTGQLGIAYYPPKTGVIELWIPLIINEIRSFGKHHAELGAGYIFTNETELIYKNGEIKEIIGGFITARIGYRYQNPDGKFLFRIAFTPFIEQASTLYVYPSGGLAVGYNF